MKCSNLAVLSTKSYFYVVIFKLNFITFSIYFPFLFLGIWENNFPGNTGTNNKLTKLLVQF